jgi:tetratricopeptide (TPR) repeat protein
MNPRLPFVLGAIVLVLGAAGGTMWWFETKPEVPRVEPAASGIPTAARQDIPADVSGPDQPSGDLPVPPFPPRIADGDQYDKCMTMLADDPEGAEAIASSMRAAGGGDAATHCQALAMIANGDAEGGAKMLETLAHTAKAAGLMRVVLLSQASEARLIADQAEPALKDTNEALGIAPGDPDLLIGRANANDALGRANDAMDDLNQALAVDAARGDALVLRAAVWRRMDKLSEARADIERAIVLDPNDAEALLERGILRQLTGDMAGARQDWKHAQEVDPNSEAADLAAQNLTLLDAGPDKK